MTIQNQLVFHLVPPVDITGSSGVSLDSLTIGNALVDVLATVDEGFLIREKIVKGSMNLVDITRSKHLHSLVNSRTEMSGGSAANTAYGLASLGGKAGFIGKISADRLGESFANDLANVGVSFFPGVTCESEDTGRCLIVVTPDGNRTMNTFLGAASLLDAADISRDAVQSAAVVMLEGYLFDRDAAKEAFRVAAEYAHAAGRKVALTLSDSFCVDRHRADFLDLVKNNIDILFSNEDEIKSLYQVGSINDALHQLRDDCEFAAVTRNEHGSVVIDGDEVVIIDAEPVDSVVDATGAGDMYAAGFLYGFVRGKPIEQCGRIGSVVASEVISHMGSRPLVALKTILPKDLK